MLRPNPGGNGQANGMNGATRPRPEEIARSKFDQQQLTARLYRSHGTHFQGFHYNVRSRTAQASPPPAGGALAPLETKETDSKRAAREIKSPERAGLSRTMPLPSSSAILPGDRGLTVSRSKRLSAWTRTAAAAASSDIPNIAASRALVTRRPSVHRTGSAAALLDDALDDGGEPRPDDDDYDIDDQSLPAVEVPRTLQPLLGPKLSLRPPSTAVRKQQDAPGGGAGMTMDYELDARLAFSRTGQLPTTRAALQALTAAAGGHMPSLDAQGGALPADLGGGPSPMVIAATAGGAAAASGGRRSRPVSGRPVTMGAPSARKKEADAKANQLEYEKYLMSPFSFIDKVIESPYTEEFVYLNPRGPYDLGIVKYDRINPNNYYTMSRAGVTHFFQSETEFTSLDQWEREYFLYTKMMEIPFFKKYRKWKAFYIWKKDIRRRKNQQCARNLGENLFLLNKYLRKSLIELKQECYAASQWILFKVDPKHTLTLPEFRELQDAQIKDVIDRLKMLGAKVRRIALEACDTDLAKFLVTNGFRKAKSDESKLEDGPTGGAGDEEYPQKISHAEKAAIRSECRKLKQYIRLADRFIIDTLATLCFDRTRDTLNFVKREPSKAQVAAVVAAAKKKATRGGDKDSAAKLVDQPLFSVEVKLDERNPRDPILCFTPELREFQETLEVAIDSAVKQIMKPDRLLDDADFKVYTQQNAEDGDEDASSEYKPEAMVLGDEGFLEVKRGIKQGLSAAFEAATTYAANFERFKKIYVENNQTNISAHEEDPVSDWAELIHKYDEQIKQFELISTSADIGIVRVDSNRLKSILTPSPKRCLAEINRLLPLIAARKTMELLEEFKMANAKISSVPTSVEEWVEIHQFLNEVHEKQDSQKQRTTFVEELYGLMHKHDMRETEEDKNNFDRLQTMKSQFDTAVFLAESSMPTNTEKFSKDLEQKIPVLQEDVAHVAEQLKADLIANPAKDHEEVITYLSELEELLENLEKTAVRYRRYQETLGVEPTQFDALRDARTDLDIKLSLWKALKRWSELTEEWISEKFERIDADEIQRQVIAYSKVYSRANRHTGMADNPMVPILLAKIQEFKETLPVVSDLRNKDLQRHHWEEINKILGHDLRSDTEASLGTLLKLSAMAHKQDIAVIANKATNEAQLREKLGKVIDVWENHIFLPVNPYRESKEYFVLGGLDEILEKLDDSLVNISEIMGSHYVEPMRELVVEWSNKLTLFQHTLTQWTAFQRQWMYLESIFSSQDIAVELKEQKTDFDRVDRAWREIMRRTADSSKAIVAGCVPGLRDNFETYNEILEKINKALENFLEKKRRSFARFYFLATDDLLKILRESRNPLSVQPHLSKCFDNIERLEFADKDINAMISAEGERVRLGERFGDRKTEGSSLRVRGPVEQWLKNLEQEMVKTLKRLMKLGVASYENAARKDWILEEKRCGQVVMTVAQIAWCRGCEQAINSDDSKKQLDKWWKVQQKQLEELTHMVRGTLSPVERRKIVALITQDVHNRDVVERLRDGAIDKTSNFLWQQQLRFYWDMNEDDCLIKQANADFRYGYEYMGVSTRLIITPLTERCWMTITGALHIRYGASPAGPAGTGKTESTKDLAKALGYLCVVFNCQEGVTYKMTAQLFSGLAQTGAWACLDEFNRIDVEVLSVIAQQLLQIRFALKQNPIPERFLFQSSDDPIPLKSSFGCMITMNPGYAGRTELPDNLKVLFRPVAMMIPDYTQIAEIMLYAEGFEQATPLSRKMVKLYKLASEQLSQQKHYDFGMRAVKSVLVMAGALKRADPDLNENVVLIRAMRDSNIPKFLTEDLPLFHAIVHDLFPDVDIPAVDWGDLEEAIGKALEQAGLQRVDRFVTKIVQLYDTFNVRFGVMLVGPTGAGKSACYNILANAMTMLRQAGSPDEKFQVVHSHVLNPKCISMTELFGGVNPVTLDWSDGLAANIMKDATESDERREDRHWVVFDGPVDAAWIENMNTVLDDNQMLCLANSKRIKLRNELRMLFEVQDLAVASPATVSRCGMVYMTPEDLGYLPYVRTWMSRRLPLQLSKDLRTYLYSLFETKLPGGLEFIRTRGHEPIPTCDSQVTASLCALFEAMFSETAGVDFTEPVEKVQLIMDYIFAYCFTWAVGGALDEESKEQFQKYLGETFINVRPPGSFFDSFVDVREHCWKNWDTRVPSFEYDGKKPYFQLLVPTMDTVRAASMMETLILNERPVMFTGYTGVGKSVIVFDYFDAAERAKKTIIPLALTFSARTSSRKTQEAIESKLGSWKVGKRLGAPPGHKVVIFVDDVNMPELEAWGAQPPIELLRQFLDYGGFYDRQKFFWKDIVDTTLVCAGAPPGGGRNELTPRFLRHFSMLLVPRQSDATLKKIFSSILHGFVADKKFKASVQKLSDGLVTATIELYLSLSTDLQLLPTPRTSHYTFNLRDISKVFQGLLMVRPESCTDPDTMVRLWIHEASRCFMDRLVDDDDRLKFSRKVMSLVSKHFPVGSSWSHEDLFEHAPIMFADFLRPSAERSEALYEEVKARREVSKILDSHLDDFNRDHASKMNLVFFDDAINHIARISRILRQPRGNAMLIGVGGSGKQSLTRLACSMSEMPCMEMNMTKDYDYSKFQGELQKILRAAGIAGKDVVFLLTEQQIIEERFLEDINNILNSGEVPNLFPYEEMLKVIEEMTPIVKEMGLPPSRTVVYNTFVQRVRDHLHIVLCMSPVGDGFRNRCRQFPSLINCCTIDWFAAWPRDALYDVSTRFLKDIELPSDDVRRSLAELCVQFQEVIEQECEAFHQQLRRRVYTTPKSYLDMINLYLHLLNLRRTEVTKQRDHLLNGLTKLKETKEAVAGLRLTLEQLRPQQEKQTQEMMEQEQLLSQQSAVADKQQKIVEAEQKVVAQQTNEVKEVQEDAKHDLQLAMPAYNAAVKAVSRIKPDAVAEMRRLANPPPGVRMTMEAINVLLGEEPDWEIARSRTLTRTDFLKALKEYPRDEITPAMIKKLQPYYDDVELSPERLGDVSKSAQSLMVWVRAMVEYNHVSLDVAPKREKVEKMTVLLNAAMGKLKLKQQQLDEIQGKFTLLKARYQKTLDDQKSLTAKKLQTENRLRAAEKLTGLLAGESVRWKADAEQFNIELSFLVGDCFISAACVGYYGPFTGDYRARLVTKWLTMLNAHHVPVSPNYSLQQCLGNAVEIREWMAHQLPTDDVSVDSAIIVKHAQRWPLIIDPQEQAKRWIKTDSLKRGKRLVVLRFSSDNLMRVMETAVRTGTPVLIEDCGADLDHAVDGILAKNVFESKSREKMIYLGESAVPYNDKFQLFMTTKIPNPHYLPEVCIKVTLLNFTVTTQGLEDQLLGEVVRKEKWEIEKAKDDLVTSLAADRKQLSTIEEDIIHMVSETKTMDMLDNPSLITALEDSKKTSAVISTHIAEAQVNQKSNQEAREEYRPVAHRGSILYFVISELALIDPMYQYSLTYFMRLFNLSIDHAERSDSVKQRLANLMTYMTRSIYMNVSRGCFESHKLLFSFLIAIKIYRSAGEVSDQEWNALLRDSFGVTSTAAARAAGAEAKAEWPNPNPALIKASSWDFLGRLEQNLPTYYRDITRDWTVNFDTSWKSWLINDAPHKMKLPGKWDAALSPFQKLLLIKTFRSEKLLLGFKDYVEAKMGREFVDFQVPALEEVFKDTDPRTPVIFVLSQGADPTSLLFKFAKDRGFMESKGDRAERLKIVSLGQGQEELAKHTIEQAKQRGEWVLLQNCHLAKSFMPALESMVEKFGEEDLKIHDDFRLWLTSMPISYFPVTVLQKGVKLTNEPPKGLKANLLRSFTTVINAEEFEHIKKDKEQPWKKLAFGLCFFHAVIQERKKFGPLGWNKAYEFNDSDLETAFQVLKMFLEEQSVIPWDALRYMCGQINYGGRVTDDWDRRCLMSILNRFFTPQILSDKYRFCALPNYYAPPTGPLSSYVAYLNDKLGSDAEPEVFGMHENANLTSQRQETNLLLSTILSIQPREAATGGGSSAAKSDHQVLDMVRSIEEKMPDPLLRKNAGPETFPTGRDRMVDSLGTVLLQEMDRFNILISRMQKTLIAVRRAIAGEVLMSSELDLMYQSLLNGTVPEVWAEVGYPSLKPLASWYSDLRRRIDFMREWLTNGPPNAFWLSGFFFPQGFLTGVLQNHARRVTDAGGNRIAIDFLTFSFVIKTVWMDRKQVDRPPETGVYIDGLFLDGARWDSERKTLEDSHLGELFPRMPIIHFIPTNIKSGWKPNPKDYLCPVYKTSARAGILSTTGHSTNFVLPVLLPTTREPDYWVLKGAALLCQLDD